MNEDTGYETLFLSGVLCQKIGKLRILRLIKDFFAGKILNEDKKRV